MAGASMFARGPSAREADRDGSGARASNSHAEVTRPALDAAIAALVRWIERAPGDPGTPLQANLRLLAFGRAALGPGDSQPRVALALANLEALTGSKPPALQLAALPEPATLADARDGDSLATLAILLETGIGLDEPLPLPSGPTSVRRLLELALPHIAERRATPDPWSLDLLSFAVLGGMQERRAELVRSTLSCLTQLEREQRPLSESQGDGAPSAGVLERLGTEFWQRRATGERRGRELQLSASVFRAVAVLTEPDLEQRAVRLLNALLYRYQLERDLYRRLLARAQDDAQRAVVHLEALEALGRLEQALYGAHLTFRHRDRPGPAPRTAISMRRAASDLIEHLSALEQGSVFAAGAALSGKLGSEALIRAATQALRGLRAARVAS